MLRTQFCSWLPGQSFTFKNRSCEIHTALYWYRAHPMQNWYQNWGLKILGPQIVTPSWHSTISSHGQLKSQCNSTLRSSNSNFFMPFCSNSPYLYIPFTFFWTVETRSRKGDSKTSASTSLLYDAKLRGPKLLQNCKQQGFRFSNLIQVSILQYSYFPAFILCCTCQVYLWLPICVSSSNDSISPVAASVLRSLHSKRDLLGDSILPN